MNTVDSLLKKPFVSLSFEEQLQIKKLGPHQPPLKIEQPTRDRGKEYQRKFCTDWYKKKKWLCGSESRKALFCFPCLLFGGDYAWTKTGVTDLKHLSEKCRRHDILASHIEACMQLGMLEQSVAVNSLEDGYRLEMIMHREQVQKSHYLLTKLIDCVRFCGSFNLTSPSRRPSSSKSLSSGILHGLIDFMSGLDGKMEEKLKDVTSFKESAVAIQNELLDCMLEVCRDVINYQIKISPFVSIQVGDTTGVSSRCQMMLVYRYVVDTRPVERFWGFASVADASKPEGIAQVIVDQLRQRLQNAPEKLVAQSYDGATLMKSRQGDNSDDAQTSVSRCYPYAYLVHSYAQPLSLIMEQATSEIPEVRVFFASLSSFPAFFSKSQKHRDQLDTPAVKKEPGVDQSTLLSVRIEADALTGVFESRDAVARCLEAIQLSRDFDAVSVREASMLLHTLRDASFAFFLALFNRLMRHVDVLSDRLQNVGVTSEEDVSFALQEFDSSILRIAEQFQSGEPDESMSDTGVAAAATGLQLNGQLVVDHTDQRQCDTVLEICDILLLNAKKRCSSADHHAVAQLLNRSFFGEYSYSFPEALLARAIKAYPMLDRTKLHVELMTIYCKPEFRGVQGVAAMLELIVANRLEDTLSEVARLVRILLTMPLVTSETERRFDTLKQANFFLSNTQAEDRLNALAMLYIERDLINDINDFSQKVIEKFVCHENRHLGFLYK